MSEHLKGFQEIDLTIIGLIIFFVLFILFFLSTYLPSQKKIHAHLRNLPFDDESPAEEK